MLTRVITLMAGLVFVSHCGRSPHQIDDKRSDETEETTSESSAFVGSCQHTTKKACVDGHIVSSPDIAVEGLSFFDANDLGLRFDELIDIYSNDKNPLAVPESSLTVEPTITNESFAEGFKVYIKSDMATVESRNVRGKFHIHELDPGYYTIRVQKKLTISIATEEQSGTFCGTLYSDAEIELVKGQKHSYKIDSYQLQLEDRTCENSKNSKITLRNSQR